MAESLQASILYLSQSEVLSGNVCQKLMYDTLPWDFYWPAKAKYINDLAKHCSESCKMREDFGHKQQLNQLHARGPLEIFAMHILGPLPKDIQLEGIFTVKTNRYSKFRHAVFLSKTKASNVLLTLIKDLVKLYCIPRFLLTDNEQQFMNRLFNAFCRFLGCRVLTKAAYHSQTYSQAQHFNKTIDAMLCQKISDH